MIVSLHAGSKFWHTSKIIQAISEVDYNKLERHKNGEPGPSTSVVNLVSESSSEDFHKLFTVNKKKLKRKRKVSPPPDTSQTDSDLSTTAPTPPPSKFRATVDVRQLLLDDLIKSKCPGTKKSILCEIFTCIICKELVVDDKVPVMPSCCSSMLSCKQCLEQWLEAAGVCPHCRQPISIDDCISQPPIMLRVCYNHRPVNSQDFGVRLKISVLN